MQKALQATTLVSLLLVALLAGGCSDDNGTAPREGTGRIVVNLIDAPGDYQQVNVEVIRVEVHASDAPDSSNGWFVISEDTTDVDLLTLTDGNRSVLADTTLPAGDYTQIRLVLGEGNTVMVDSLLFDLEVPSGSQSGLKLNHPFTINDGALYTFTLDFDADRSVNRTGNGQYKLKPVIRLIVDQISGSLIGTVSPAAARARIQTVAGTDTVTAWADSLDGSFRFEMLPAGAYDLMIAATAGAYRDTVLVGQSVTAGATTDVGVVLLQAP